MNQRKCRITECKGNIVAKGYCNKHYLRLKKHKDPLKTKHQERCSIKGCEKKHFGLGLCDMHHGRVRRHGDVFLKIRKPLVGSLQERFNRSYDINIKTGCWEWNRALTANGYGHMKMDYKNIQAHRLAYELYVGEIKNSLFVCHTCDNRKCVNPAHLWVGTNTDNMRDMIKKGRGRKIESRVCKIKDCNKIYYCRGYCKNHYGRWKYHEEKTHV